MSYRQEPRYITSVLVEERDNSVIITWGLGDVVPGGADHFEYGVDYYGPDGNGGKRFDVGFFDEPSAHVFEWSSNTNANYDASSVVPIESGLVVFYRDASIGLPKVGTIQAYLSVHGQDVQTGFPVTLVR
ncbi:hypothetical protein [Microbacterium sp. NPDC058389]|uniref:hypothetical protein n=1 Tax=Microbacterium sp. NPDC058389 TaxID=3346475 RepID=UPI0036480C5F